MTRKVARLAAAASPLLMTACAAALERASASDTPFVESCMIYTGFIVGGLLAVIVVAISNMRL